MNARPQNTTLTCLLAIGLSLLTVLYVQVEKRVSQLSLENARLISDNTIIRHEMECVISSDTIINITFKEHLYDKLNKPDHNQLMHDLHFIKDSC